MRRSRITARRASTPERRRARTEASTDRSAPAIGPGAMTWRILSIRPSVAEWYTRPAVLCSLPEVPLWEARPVKPSDTDRKSTREELLEKHLADRFDQLMVQHHPRVVLVASARIGEGKSLYVELLRGELGPEKIVIIDGPAMNESAGSLAIPAPWQQAIDVAVLVVLGRGTTGAGLREAASRLEAMGVRVVGAVFNDARSPRLPGWLPGFLGPLAGAGGAR